jgi:hypothetical protein
MDKPSFPDVLMIYPVTIDAHIWNSFHVTMFYRLKTYNRI